MCHLYNFVIIYKHSNNPKNSIFKIGLFFVVIFSPFLGYFFFHLSSTSCFFSQNYSHRFTTNPYSHFHSISSIPIHLLTLFPPVSSHPFFSNKKIPHFFSFFAQTHTHTHKLPNQTIFPQIFTLIYRISKFSTSGPYPSPSSYIHTIPSSICI